ncbi:MAG: ribonuclease D [Acidimicrobiia bacterium]|nr:ribonuclease D [Acidimicrobiia bacterium]MYC58504.1 ribonuclease D [Acidimicrobiia bacterium]MYG94262.1 ribonuclease D [Acidimicrobiia bacterium]MYI30390.1 ribonuclease D [Acidimicrobiia bacterium]
MQPITSEGELTAVLADAASAKSYAIDTEFHRERTYHPRLGLVQVAWKDQLALIDPLAVSIAPLKDLLASKALAVLHAAEQDLEVFKHECHTLPKAIFDTQVAAGFIGYSSPSLATIHERLLGVKLAKQARLWDWFQRPLPQNMLEYAAADVARLLEIKNILCEDLRVRGRLSWAQEECALLLERANKARDAKNAWRKIKEVSRMEGQPQAVAKALACWREEHASKVNQPVRHVLSDLGVAVIAQRMPSSLKQLRNLRGVEPRNLRHGADEELLEVLDDLRNSDLPTAPPVKPLKLPVELKPAVSLISSWVAQHAVELELNPALLASRNDIEDLIAGNPDCKAAKGWRAEILATPVQQLLGGAVAVALDPDGKLALEERSGRPIALMASN